MNRICYKHIKHNNNLRKLPVSSATLTRPRGNASKQTPTTKLLLNVSIKLTIFLALLQFSLQMITLFGFFHSNSSSTLLQITSQDKKTNISFYTWECSPLHPSIEEITVSCFTYLLFMFIKYNGKNNKIAPSSIIYFSFLIINKTIIGFARSAICTFY